MNTRQTVLLTAVAAFAGGFLAGLLYAPHSGPEVRRRIAQKARGSSRWMEGQLHKVEDQLTELEEQVLKTSSQLGDKLRTATQSAVDQIVPSLPDDAESWGVEKEDLAQDLRHLPRK